MQIDIPVHIEKLLFLHDSLTIPGFGTFTATKTPASSDYVGGTVTPPSKSLTFTENLVVDDGILVNDVAVAHSISTEDARKAVEEYVGKIQGLLNQREIVTLPNVGRLYKNYVQKIQFLPDTTNFNPESFGLPPLQFSPLARSREVEKSQEVPAAPVRTPAPATSVRPASVQTPAPAPPTMPEPYVPTAARSGGAGWATALGITLLLCALTGAIWLYRNQKTKPGIAQTDNTERTANPLPGSGKTNEPPKKAEKPAQPEETTITLSQKKDDADDDEQIKESVAEKMAAAREEAKAGQAVKGGRECILVVATLREKANADRLEQMLKEEGFKVYYLQKNGYQVGIQFNYTKVGEIQEKIVTLQNLTGEKEIWIKKK